MVLCDLLEPTPAMLRNGVPKSGMSIMASSSPATQKQVNVA